MVGPSSLLVTALLITGAAANHALGRANDYGVVDPVADAGLGARGLFDEAAGIGMGKEHWKRATKAKGAAAS